jgi:uncharacterized protein (UPF0179 family)
MKEIIKGELYLARGHLYKVVRVEDRLNEKCFIVDADTGINVFMVEYPTYIGGKKIETDKKIVEILNKMDERNEKDKSS